MTLKILKSQSGFGFLGMMILVIFMALAGSVVMTTVDSTVSNQQLDETIKKMDRVVAAAKKYKADNSGANPPSLSRLVSNTAPPSPTSTPCEANPATSKMRYWCGPYLDVEITGNANDYLTDGWATAFEYDSTTGTIFSWGPNRIDNNGTGDDFSRTF